MLKWLIGDLSNKKMGITVTHEADDYITPRDILFFPLALPFQDYGPPYRGTPQGLSQDYMTARLQLQAKDKLNTCLQGTQLLIYGV